MTIRSRIPSEEYKKNFEAIFRRRQGTDSAGSSIESDACSRGTNQPVPVVQNSNPTENMLEVSRENGRTR